MPPTPRAEPTGISRWARTPGMVAPPPARTPLTTSTSCSAATTRRAGRTIPRSRRLSDDGNRPHRGTDAPPQVNRPTHRAGASPTGGVRGVVGRRGWRCRRCGRGRSWCRSWCRDVVQWQIVDAAEEVAEFGDAVVEVFAALFDESIGIEQQCRFGRQYPRVGGPVEVGA